MAVHVNEMVSDVSAEMDAQSDSSVEAIDWRELERLGKAHARLECDRRRTAAEGYND